MLVVLMPSALGLTDGASVRVAAENLEYRVAERGAIVLGRVSRSGLSDDACSFDPALGGGRRCRRANRGTDGRDFGGWEEDSPVPDIYVGFAWDNRY